MEAWTLIVLVLQELTSGQITVGVHRPIAYKTEEVCLEKARKLESLVKKVVDDKRKVFTFCVQPVNSH